MANASRTKDTASTADLLQEPIQPDVDIDSLIPIPLSQDPTLYPSTELADFIDPALIGPKNEHSQEESGLDHEATDDAFNTLDTIPAGDFVPEPVQPDFDIGSPIPQPQAMTFSPSTGMVVLLDPHLIRPSGSPNREESSFDDEAADDLQMSLEAGGGNEVPIGVTEQVQPDGSLMYIIVYGERRWRGCLKVGLKVRAEILSRKSALEDGLRRIRENVNRKRLAPIEFGRQLQYLLDVDRHCTQRKLAEALGRGEDQISKALQLARLDVNVLHAFVRTQDLKYEDRLPLQRAFKLNAHAVAQEAKRIRALVEPPPANEIVALLVAASKTGAAASASPAKPKLASSKLAYDPMPPLILQSEGKPVGQLKQLPDRSTEVVITEPLTPVHVQRLAERIESFFKGKVLPKTDEKIVATTGSATGGNSDGLAPSKSGGQPVSS